MEHESMFRLVVEVMMWGTFSWHTLGSWYSVLTEYHLKATADLSIIADHVHPFMTTVDPSTDGYFQQDKQHVLKLRSSQTGFLNMTMSSL